jgi:hypothetical protein
MIRVRARESAASALHITGDRGNCQDACSLLQSNTLTIAR